MKKIKIAFWVIVIALLALVIIQNKDFFLETRILGINLWFTEYQSPELANAIFFLAFFFAGVLISYFFSLFERFRSRKTIKELNATIENRNQMLNTLKSEIESLKVGSTAQPPPHEEIPEETAGEKPPAESATTVVDQ